MTTEEIYALWRQRVEAVGAVGMVVKCGFQTDPQYDLHMEWMFVEITDTRGDEWYGTLLNKPAYIANLRQRERVKIPVEIFSAEPPEWASDELKSKWAAVVNGEEQ
jgi:hypothetical protein